MADDADVAQRSIEVMNRTAATVKREVPDLTPGDHCHYCGEGLDSVRLYCDRYCCEDHARIGYK